jgi:hypothetical protein
MRTNLDELPIPPLEPSWYRDGGGVWPRYEEFSASAVHREIIFKMSMMDYQIRMENESARLKREQHLESILRDQTQLIVRQREQIEDLQAAKYPSVPALRQAFAEDLINQEEFDRLVAYSIAGQS